jgi:hypothetical protein
VYLASGHPGRLVGALRPALRRVVAASVPQREQEPLWLLIEWRDGEPEPANCFLVSLPGPRTKKQLIRWVMQ